MSKSIMKPEGAFLILENFWLLFLVFQRSKTIILKFLLCSVFYLLIYNTSHFPQYQQITISTWTKASKQARECHSFNPKNSISFLMNSKQAYHIIFPQVRFFFRIISYITERPVKISRDHIVGPITWIA